LEEKYPNRCQRGGRGNEIGKGKAGKGRIGRITSSQGSSLGGPVRGGSGKSKGDANGGGGWHLRIRGAPLPLNTKPERYSRQGGKEKEHLE